MLPLIKSMLMTRGTQLIARYVAALLLVSAAYTNQEADAAALTIAQAIIALLLFGLDLLIHRVRERLSPETQTKLSGYGLWLLAVCCLIGVAGCGGQTPVANAIALEKSYKLAVDAAALLPVETRRQIAPAVNAGSAVLDELATEIGDGTRPLSAENFAAIAARVAPYLEKILQARADADRKPAKPPLGQSDSSYQLVPAVDPPTIPAAVDDAPQSPPPTGEP